MPEVYRRVVLKPPGLSANASVQLKERLAAAVQLQQRLATESPHVLQLIGRLEEDEHSFFVEHEPAQGLDVNSLFDQQAPPVDQALLKLLLRMTAALADALRVAHSGTGRQRIVHGGLCGGVVLETSDGVHKVADFGFAPGICAVLGVESYLELAVRPNPEGPPVPQGTGVWEVLSPEEATRDDRICGFIDPDKYGSQTLNTFEPGSDVMAAGILLHLLAEHRHPMLEDPEGHRMVVLAESMAFLPYDGGRRPELRESTEPAARCWCELVAGMLSRLPKDRPSTADVLAALKGVKVSPAGLAKMLEGLLQSVRDLIDNRELDRARDKLEGIPAGDDTPPDLVELAEELRQEVKAHDVLGEARKRLKSDDWPRAQDALDQLTSMSHLPPEVAEHADKVAATVRHNRKVQEELDRIEASFGETATTDPAKALDVVQVSLDRLARLSEDKNLVAPLRARCDHLRADLTNEREKLQARVKEWEAARKLVENWFAELKTAWDQENWSDFEGLLKSRPETPHWPGIIKAQTKELEQQYAELKKVPPWIERVREALDTGKLDIAKWLLTTGKPKLTRWPTTLRNEPERFEDRLRAIEEEIEEAARQARSWLQSAEQAAQEHDWERALGILEAPTVDAKRIPDDVRAQVDRLVPVYQRELQEARRRQLEERTQTVRKLAAALVRGLITQDLPGLLAPEIVDTTVSSFKWNSLETPTHGNADLNVAVLGAPDQVDEKRFERRFEFRLDVDPPQICDQDQAIRAALRNSLTKVVETSQRLQADELATPLRHGLFPEAQAEVKLGQPVRRMTATISLLGAGAPEVEVETELVWDPKVLTWAYADPTILAGRALDLVKDRVDELVRPKVLEQSETLRRYGDLLDVEVALPPLADSATIPSSLQLQCRLAIRTPGQRDRQLLLRFPVLCRKVGEVVIGADLKPAEVRLQELLVKRQRSLRAAMERGLKEQVKAAPAKVRLAALTRQIKRPVDQVQFELRPKRGDRCTLTASWNADTLDFEIPDKARTGLDELLRGAPIAAERHRPAAPTIEREPAKKEPGLPRRVIRPRAFALTAVAVAIGLVGVVPLLRSRPAPAPEPPSPGTFRSPDEALDAVRDVLADSPYLADHVQTLVSETERQADSQLTVECLLPGLQNPVHTLILSLDPDQPSPLSQQDRETLEREVSALDLLLRNASQTLSREVRRTIAEVLDGRFVDSAGLDVRLGSDVPWSMDRLAAAWKASNVPITIMFVSASGLRTTAENVELPEAGDIKLVDLTTNLEVAGGELTWGNDRVVAGIMDQIPVTLRDRQDRLLATRVDDLREQIMALEADIRTEPEVLAELQERVNVLVEAPRLDRRQLVLNWDARSLAFTSETWQTDIDGLLQEHQALAALNEMIAQEALETVRNTLADMSERLKDHLQGLVSRVEARGDQQLRVAYMLPGLEQPERSLILDLDEFQDVPLSGDNLRRVTQYVREQTDSGVKQLDQLMDTVAIKVAEQVAATLTDDELFAPFISGSGMRARLDRVSWSLDSDRKGWSAGNAELTVMFKPASHPGGTAEAPEIQEEQEGRPIELAAIVRDLAVRDGVVSVTESGDEVERLKNLKDQVLATVRSRQAESIQALEDQIRTIVPDADVGRRPDTLEELLGTIELAVEVPRLTLRRFGLDWDRHRLVFDSESWQTDIDTLRQVHTALAAIDRRIVEQDHWIRLGRPDGSAPVLVEMTEPVDGQWTLSLTPPWSVPSDPDAQDERWPIRANIAGDPPELEVPVYWPLIEKYAELTAGPLFLTDTEELEVLTGDMQEDLGAGDDRVTNLSDDLNPETPPEHVVPRIDLINKVKPELSGVPSAAGRSDEPSTQLELELTVQARFGLRPDDEVGGPLSGNISDYLDEALDTLTRNKVGAIPTCTLTLAVSGANAAMHWSGLDNVVSGLSATVAEAKQLDLLLGQLPEREALAQSLENELGGGGPVELDPHRAYQLLQNIWRVKPPGRRWTPPAGVNNFQSFSLNRQREFKKRFSTRNKQRVSPTIFVEYFCGPRWTYAIVWSVKRPGVAIPGETIPEGPFLIRVYSTTQFYDATGDQPAEDLGSTLFDSVLDVVTSAVEAKAGGPFEKWLGIAVAHDDHLTLTPLPNLEFTVKRSYLEPADLNTQLQTREVEWNSLDELRNSEWACDYILLQRLSDARPSFQQLRGAKPWAIRQLDRAMQRTPPRGD